MFRIFLILIGLGLILISCEPKLYTLRMKDDYHNKLVKKEHDHAYMRHLGNKDIVLTYICQLKNTSSDTLLIDCKKQKAEVNLKKFTLKMAFATYDSDRVFYNLSESLNEKLVLNPRESVDLTFLFGLDKVPDDQFNEILKDSIIFSFSDSRIELSAKSVYIKN